jgi:hypothetical protein
MQSDIPSVQVLEYQPELTHSVWIDYIHRRKTIKMLEKELKRGIKSGKFIGYRFLTIHK